VFAAAVALDASLIAWVAQNYDTTQPVIRNIAWVVAAFLTCLVMYVSHDVNRLLNELEEL
jgi:hypothetical protein